MPHFALASVKVLKGQNELLMNVEMGWEIVKELKNSTFIMRAPRNNNHFKHPPIIKAGRKMGLGLVED